MENLTSPYSIVGNDYLVKLKISLLNNQGRQFSIGNATFDFDESINNIQEEQKPSDPFSAQVLQESRINSELDSTQIRLLLECLRKYHTAFSTTSNQFGAVMGHEVSITLTVDQPYPSILKKAPYPASPRSRKTIEEHIAMLIKLGVLRKVGANKGVDITTPVIIAWHNGKSRLVGDFRALNTYTVPDRYPMPKITESLTKLHGAKYITCMDVLKGFHQNVVKQDSRHFL
jgi:hypothetical protein